MRQKTFRASLLIMSQVHMRLDVQHNQVTNLKLSLQDMELG